MANGRGRRPALAIAVVVSVVAAALAAISLAAAAPATTQFIDGFSREVVFSGLELPTNLRFAPSGKVFVAQKGGQVVVFDSTTSTNSRLVADLSSVVHNTGDRGLLGLAVDPEYPTRPFVYVAYTLNAPPGATAPFYPGNDCPSPPGANTDGCVVQGRLSKLTLNSNDQLVSEQVLITDWCQQFSSHSVGDLRFGADGALYMSGGEGGSFTFADYGQTVGAPGTAISPTSTPANPCNDPPSQIGTPLEATTSMGGALRAQSFDRPAGLPVTLGGTLIRVDPDTGEALPDNPAAADPDANRRRIVAYGFRNPYRMTVRPGTDEMWVNMVGGAETESLHRIADPTQGPVPNAGWPCYEGSKPQEAYAAVNNSVCNALYAKGHAKPYFEYAHYGAGSQLGTGTEGVNGTSCALGSGAMTGAAFYNGGSYGAAQPTSNYPLAYDGALFFTDYSRRCIYSMLPGPDGLPDPTNIKVIGAEVSGDTDGGAVAMEPGPDGRIWWVDIVSGTISRLVYRADNPPVARIGTDPNPASIQPGQSVSFDSIGSSDPAGGTLEYSWDLDGDGTFGDATAATASWTYDESGDYRVTLRVTGSGGVTTTARVTVHVAASEPVIDQPTASTNWAVGTPITLSGHATDSVTGQPLPESAFEWQVEIRHCPNDACHIHVLTTLSGSGQDPDHPLTITAPDHEYPASLVVTQKVTNRGTVDTASVELQPLTNTLTLQTEPPGLTVAANESSGPTPRTLTVIRGSSNLVSAPRQVVGTANHSFASWSDGGTPTHNVTVSEDTTLTATFDVVDDPVLPWPPSMPYQWRLNGSASPVADGVRLTRATPDEAGSAFYASPVPTGALQVDFDVTMSGGSGADGLTFTIADPSTSPTAVGGTGSLLGFGGIEGTAITFDSYENGFTNDPSDNFVAITQGLDDGVLSYLATNADVPSLRGSTRHATVTASGGRLRLVIDGTTYLDVAVTLPPTAILGFTASTGGATQEHTVTNVVANTAAGPVDPDPPGGSLQMNGSASAVEAGVRLTPATPEAAGSAFFASPVPTGSLQVDFDFQMSGGSGSDGLTFTLADPSTPPTAVGGAGSRLGFGGITGTAVTFDTYENAFTNDPSANFVAISQGLDGGVLSYLATNSEVPPLRDGTRHATVTSSGGRLRLAIDGTTYLDAAVTLPPTALIGFTASTGGGTDDHTVTNIVVDIAAEPPTDSWRLNGSASPVPDGVRLTPATPDAAGSAFLPTPVPTGSLQVDFDLTMSGGSGADGLTFTLADPSTPPTAVGGAGSRLGFGGITGTAVTFDTYENGFTNDPSANFVAISQGLDGGVLSYLATNTDVPPLRGATRHATVTASGGRLRLVIDGTTYLDAAVTLPPTAVLGFTASTGGGAQNHTVTNIVVDTAADPIDPDPPIEGMQLNGSASSVANGVRLTPATPDAAGSAFFTAPVSTGSLQVDFDVQMSGGSGADGLTLTLADPSTPATALGGTGSRLGFGGITGTAVTFDTYENAFTNDPSANFVAISQGLDGGVLSYLATNTEVPALRGATRHATVTVSGGRLRLVIDGMTYLDAAVTLPPTALLGFTASTGGGSQSHTVTNIVVGQP